MERTKYEGRSLWAKLDPITRQPTGEVKEVDEFQKDVNPNARHGFMITYLSEVISLIDKLGNQKMKVVKFILEHMDKRSNVLIMTVKEITKKSGIGYNTVIDTLRILDNAGIIQRRTGAIMLSPKLMNNRTGGGEASMMITYRQWGAEKEEPQETPPTPAPESKQETEGEQAA